MHVYDVHLQELAASPPTPEALSSSLFWSFLWTLIFFFIWSIHFLGCFLGSTAVASTILLELLLHHYGLSTVLPRLALAGWCEMHHQRRKVATNTATPVYCEIQRAFPDDDGLNQHCVNLFGKGLNVTDIHLYVKVPHSIFKALKLYRTSV